MNALVALETETTANTPAPLDEDVREYVAKFIGFANKSAESVLEMCKVVADASVTLPKERFDVFCSEIGLKSSAAISKMKTIGERYAQLSQYKDRLPAAWTTLYRIAQIDDAKLGEAVEGKLLHPNMTAKELAVIAPVPQRNKREQSKTTQPSDEPKSANDYLYAIKPLVVPSASKEAELREWLAMICEEFQFELVAKAA